jgi:acyl-CoA synthetase (NDP forming)
VDRERARTILCKAGAEGRRRLDEIESLQLLAAYGIPTACTRFAADPDSAARVAADIGCPVALKIVSPEIVHKSDVGGVRVGLATPVEVQVAAAEMLEAVRRQVPEATVRGFVVQRMMTGGRETIAGLTRESGFGPLVMFGLGGVYVEAIGDVTFRVAPIGTLEARDMLTGIRGAGILRGIRGAPPVDFGALGEVLRRLGQLGADFPEIAELDANPLLAFPEGVHAVDARVLLRQP